MVLYQIMRLIIITLITVYLLILPCLADEDPRFAANSPELAAKKYLAYKNDCEVNDLITEQVLEGKSGAFVYIRYQSIVKKVKVIKEDSKWIAEGVD